jgi:hypothetical protein
MASTGDPSTFSFTMDALPAYTMFNKKKKALCAIQIIDDSITSSSAEAVTMASATATIKEAEADGTTKTTTQQPS